MEIKINGSAEEMKTLFGGDVVLNKSVNPLKHLSTQHGVTTKPLCSFSKSSCNADGVLFYKDFDSRVPVKYLDNSTCVGIINGNRQIGIIEKGKFIYKAIFDLVSKNDDLFLNYQGIDYLIR
ncbi:hypothetical protein M2S00_06765 [Apilactobacillus sp. TMW 2.2459]|uniref:hypothetical protein n=1 Tax=Apilactobacillus xinyiensis TaxID=2841032 RepID=UPI00200BEA5C|nr:hypothetical protein [Apilactobacillus xinyiensis]MCL0312806.1 hypothetical protein [Apilactobacillus xinyiensis]